MNKRNSLQQITTIVADTGEIEEIKKFKPTDATTNPSLIFKASGMPEYASLIEDALSYAKKGKSKNEQLTLALDKAFVNFGLEILKTVPGRVSTEVDARLSFDVEGSIEKAHTLIGLYEKAGIDRKRILIKLASTWEGVQAAKTLEKEGIHCNMTLMFSLPQAIACADIAHATLISPFVGRILDWYKKAENKEGYPSDEDPGVLSVKEIFNYYKKMDIKTQIMGASFRNKEEVLELAGCDLLTISPQLLKELEEAEGTAPRKLDASKAKGMDIKPLKIDEKTFRWMLCDNAMAVEKLMEGIRTFAKDIVKLEKHFAERL